jgi:hypothetical protein
VELGRHQALQDMSPTRTPRREPARRLTAPPDRNQAAFARGLCRDVASIIDDPLTLERWTSSLLGRLWVRHRRNPAPLQHDPGFALAICSPLDGEVIFLEAEQPAFGPHTVAVYIDYRLGGIAKHLGLILPLEQIDTEVLADPALDGRRREAVPIEPVFACRRIRAALELTEARPHLPVGDTFADVRAIALARASALEL